MKFKLDSMNISRRPKLPADAPEELRIFRMTGEKERRRRVEVVRRMRADPAFSELTAEAQEQLIRAALTDDWGSVLPRLPTI